MSILDRIFGWRKPRLVVQEAPPAISTPWGNVTESARRQAAINMRNDAQLRERVLTVVIKECDGDEDRGLTEFMRRFPEVFSDLE